MGIEKEQFLKKYRLKEVYREDKISWKKIEEILEDYCNKKTELDTIRDSLFSGINDELKGLCQMTESRLKEPEHLAEKIIRKVCIEDSNKYKDIGKDNYLNIVSDVIGIRVLVLSKEEWEAVHDKIIEIAQDENKGISLREAKAYVRYGDRDVFRDKIEKAYTNKGYRSQHYTFVYQGCLCEIQVRTVAEQVFGEFDHRIRYPYRQENKFLMRYSVVMGQIMSVADELISSCMSMGEDIWEESDKRFQKDEYIDATKRNMPTQKQADGDKESSKRNIGLNNAKDIANNMVARKGEKKGG